VRVAHGFLNANKLDTENLFAYAGRQVKPQMPKLGIIVRKHRVWNEKQPVPVKIRENLAALTTISLL
jgi:hypothetical protein